MKSSPDRNEVHKAGALLEMACNAFEQAPRDSIYSRSQSGIPAMDIGPIPQKIAIGLSIGNSLNKTCSTYLDLYANPAQYSEEQVIQALMIVYRLKLAWRKVSGFDGGDTIAELDISQSRRAGEK